MARMPRIDVAGLAQHLIQRGNNRQVCFGCEEDMAENEPKGSDSIETMEDTELISGGII